VGYRAEIDGLRAIAVISVLIFHFFPRALPLGYLGVDLFFVISGFLISTYIIEENRKGRFSFREFYYRRVKRILPAACAVLLVTSTVASAFLTPPDIRNYASSLIATLTFTANIYFWRTGGYFGSNDELKPLLHMWSLGVEEQFYLIFPLLLVVMMRFVRRPSALFCAVLALSLLSLAFNVALLRIGGANPAFFLLPARVWQFGVGALAAIYTLGTRAEHKPVYTVAGLLVLIAAFFISLPVLPPGFGVSCAAAFLLARRHRADGWAAWCLQNPVARSVGLISFSLYLWHWPIVVFIKYHTVEAPSPAYLAAGIALTFVLSWLSYLYIERPFRKNFPGTVVVGSSVASCVALGLFALFCLNAGYFQMINPALVSRIAEATQTNYRCSMSDYIAYGSSRACYINKSLANDYDLALVGNSHAQMYVPSLQKVLLSEGRKGLLIPLNNCLPTTDINLSPECLRLARGNYAAFMADKRIKTVIFAMTWYSDSWVGTDGATVPDPKKLVLAQSLLNLVGTVEASGRKVLLVGPLEVPHYDLPSVLSRKVKFGMVNAEQAVEALRVPRSGFDQQFGEAIALLKTKLGGKFIVPSEVLCDSHYCFFGDRDRVYFADSNHLSLAGALSMESMFHQALEADRALAPAPVEKHSG